MDLAASLAMTALTTQHDEAGVVGGCRQLAQITKANADNQSESLRPETIQLGKRQNSFHLKIR